MDRRAFLVLTGSLPLLVPYGGRAEQSGKVYRIGYLSFEPAPTPDIPALGLASLHKGLRNLGYVEGQNLVVEYRWANLDREKIPQLATDLVGRGIELLVTWATGVVMSVKTVTSTLPIVCALCADLVGGGAVTSLARPGGNVTGLTAIGPDLAAKRLEFLRALGISRVVGLHSAAPTFPVVIQWRSENERAAQMLGLRVETLRANSTETLRQSMETAAKAERTGITFMEEPFYLRERKRIAEIATHYRLPTAFPFREHVESGGLLSYGINVPDLFWRTATYVDKILKGTKPADLPVEQPTNFELVINRRTARAIGLTIPPSLLQRADQLVE